MERNAGPRQILVAPFVGDEVDGAGTFPEAVEGSEIDHPGASVFRLHANVQLTLPASDGDSSFQVDGQLLEVGTVGDDLVSRAEAQLEPKGARAGGALSVEDGETGHEGEEEEDGAAEGRGERPDGPALAGEDEGQSGRRRISPVPPHFLPRISEKVTGQIERCQKRDLQPPHGSCRKCSPSRPQPSLCNGSNLLAEGDRIDPQAAFGGSKEYLAWIDPSGRRGFRTGNDNDNRARLIDSIPADQDHRTDARLLRTFNEIEARLVHIPSSQGALSAFLNASQSASANSSAICTASRW